MAGNASHALKICNTRALHASHCQTVRLREHVHMNIEGHFKARMASPRYGAHTPGRGENYLVPRVLFFPFPFDLETALRVAAASFLGAGVLDVTGADEEGGRGAFAAGDAGRVFVAAAAGGGWSGMEAGCEPAAGAAGRGRMSASPARPVSRRMSCCTYAERERPSARARASSTFSRSSGRETGTGLCVLMGAPDNRY